MNSDKLRDLFKKCDNDVDIFIDLLDEIDGMNTSYHAETVERLTQTIKKLEETIKDQNNHIRDILEKLRVARELNPYT